jgi:hypothetical protein
MNDTSLYTITWSSTDGSPKAVSQPICTPAVFSFKVSPITCGFLDAAIVPPDEFFIWAGGFCDPENPFDE